MMQTNRCGGGGDDLLAGERGAAALDQNAVGGGFIGAVDVQAQGRRGIEIEFRNARGAQRFGGLARTRDRAGKLDFTVFQQLR